MTVRAHCQVTTFDATSNAVMTSATVNVYTPGTVTPISATIYDRLGNPLSNPLTSDATTGLCDFYLLVAQEVDLVVSKASFTTRTYSNVPVLDDSSLELTALLTTTGDIVYASGANTPVRLPIGTNNYVMNVTAGVPKWTSALQVSDANTTTGVGTAPTNAVGLTIGSTLATTSQIGLDVLPVTFTSAATTVGYGIRTSVATQAASFTMTTGAGLFVSTPTIGASSAITSLYGVNVTNQGATGITNAYGVYVAAQSGAATINEGIHVAGGSPGINVVSGGVLIAGTAPTGGANTLGFGGATAAPGGGATATLTSIGGSGPTAAAQNGWVIITLGGQARFLPVWG